MRFVCAGAFLCSSHICKSKKRRAFNDGQNLRDFDFSVGIPGNLQRVFNVKCHLGNSHRSVCHTDASGFYICPRPRERRQHRV